MIDQTPFIIHKPSTPQLPILISCPHVGTEIPSDIKSSMTEGALRVPDTDWFVHNLYAFAPQIGITLIHARYSRYVIDLNRDPNGTRLYTDQRTETSLVPTKTFHLMPIYRDHTPSKTEIERRHNLYFCPYHAKLTEILQELKNSFRNVLLFDAHSIKRFVTSIRPEPFPDVILGDQRGNTADPKLASTALSHLNRLNLSYNDPFMGGYITRHFGQPTNGVHALQLEMAQDLYMNEATGQRDGTKESIIQPILKNLLLQLAAALEGLS